MAPTSALPVGATRVVSEMQPLPVDPAQPGSGLYNAVLALAAPPNPDEAERYDEEILDLNVLGFAVMFVLFLPLPLNIQLTSYNHDRTSLDLPTRRMTVLSPTQGSLTGRTAIVGSFEWHE